MKIDSSMETSLVFKREIVNATGENQSVLKDLLKDAKQEKITNFFNHSPSMILIINIVKKS